MRVIQSGFIFTGITKATHHDMFETNAEAVFSRKGLLNLIEEIFRAFRGFAAPPANQVMMMSFFSVMVDEMIAGFTLENTPGLFQDIQSAVNSRLIYSRHLALHIADNILSRKM